MLWDIYIFSVARAPKMYLAHFRQTEGPSFCTWPCKETIRVVLPAIPMCTSFLLLVRTTCIAGKKKRCLMVVKCNESSFKRKTKSKVTNDNNKGLEKLILPSGNSFPLQNHISMAGMLPASTQEREVSAVTRGVILSAVSVITLPDTASCACQAKDPLPWNQAIISLIHFWSQAWLGPFQHSEFPFRHCKTWEVSFYSTGGCCEISG